MTTYQRTPRDARKAAKNVREGDELYVVLNIAPNIAPYEDAKLYARYTAGKLQHLTGARMISGSMSVERLVLLHGPVYTRPPGQMRNVATPGPQVGGPLPEGYEAFLDEAEIRGLEKQVADSPDPKTRRRLGAWGL